MPLFLITRSDSSEDLWITPESWGPLEAASTYETNHPTAAPVRAQLVETDALDLMVAA